MSWLKIVYMAAIVPLLLCSCQRSFKVTAELKNLGTQNLQILYATPSGINDLWITSNNDVVEIKGFSEELTLVVIYNSHKQLIARVVAKNGDHIKLNGAIDEPYKIHATGNKLNEEWFNFINENDKIYSSNNESMLSTLIERYVKNNPQSIVSSILLLFDYPEISDKKKMEQLVSLIDVKARPASLYETYETLLKSRPLPTKKLHRMSLLSLKNKYDYVEYSNSSYTLMYFWDNSTDMRLTTFNLMKELRERYKPKRLQLIDVIMDGDTLHWHSTIGADSTRWTHYWAPGGPINADIEKLTINRCPTVIVGDSLGNIIYHGSSTAEAEDIIDRKLSKK